MKNPKISIVIPISDMKDGAYFLWRAINSIMAQTFKDYEIVITKEGKMAENTNAAIKKARGELIKILYMDDYLAHGNTLQEIVDNFTPKTMWLASGCIHDAGDGVLVNPHFATWEEGVKTGGNTVGSPSVITLRNGLGMYFDERMSWLLDCEFYGRMYDKYGAPKILNSPDIVIGLGSHQMTNLLTDEEKLLEFNYLKK